MYTGLRPAAWARRTYEGAMCHGTNQDSGNPGYVRERQERRLRRMSDLVSVSLQDQLRRRQSEVRKRREIKKGAAFGRPFLCQEDLNGTPISVKRL